MQSTILNRITLSETSMFSDAEILLRNLPQDNAAGHVDLILEKINNGVARVYDIENGKEKVGVLVAEIYNSEFIVLATYSRKVISIFENLYPLCEEIARANRCRSIVFWTVRAGMIQKALENNWQISHVEMRKTL